MSSDIEKILNEQLVERHSYFQLKYFVIGKEPTNQSKMWRCLTELKTRKESIESIEMEIENVIDNLKLLEFRSRQDVSGTFAEAMAPVEQAIKTRQCDRQKKQMEKQVAALNKKLVNVKQEATFFEESFRSLEKIEALKPYDDLESQLQYWNEKLLEELNLKLLLRQPIDTEVVKTIMTLDGEASVKKSMVKVLQTVQEQAKMLEQKKL
jgi:hypothetical protein